MIKEDLKIFQGINSPGWLRLIENVFGLSKKDFSFLESYDEEMKKIENELKDIYYQKEYPKTQKAIYEFNKEMKKQVSDLRKENIKNEIEDLKKQLQENYDIYLKSKSPEFLKEAVWKINKSPELIKKIKRLKSELRLLESKKENKLIPHYQILQAREKPMKKVFESCEIPVGKNFLARCPFHQDKNPSMLVKGSFAYCFACGAKVDNIKFLRDYKGLSFTDSVEWLNCLSA